MGKLTTYSSGYIKCSRAACDYRDTAGKCLLSPAECSRQRAQPKTAAVKTYAARVAKLDASIKELEAMQAARKPTPTPKASPAFVRRLAPKRGAR